MTLAWETLRSWVGDTDASSMVQLQRAKKGAACEHCARRKRKCIHFKQIIQPNRAKVGTNEPLYHIPSCGETQLSYALIDTLRALRLDATWLAMIPTRLGRCPVVDSAAQAVIKNRVLAFQSDHTTGAGSLEDYVRAVEGLRGAMQNASKVLSDDVLVAVALVSICESLMRSKIFQCLAHWIALKSILLARPAGSLDSEISRAVFYHVRNQSFHIPVSSGVVSPFDDPRWYNLEPAGHGILPAEVVRLKHRGNHLMVRLPRLMMLVRKLRVDNDKNPTTLSQAIQLAQELDQVVDSVAESDLLHQIRIIKTTDATDAIFVPFSFEYANLGEMETAVVYWKARMLLGNLRRRLQEISPDSEFNKIELDDQLLRMGINIMMSLQYARNRLRYAHPRGMVGVQTGFVALWAAWEGREQYRNLPIQAVKDWNVRIENEALRVWSASATQHDIIEASDLLAGGPLVGMFVAAYRPDPFWSTKVQPHIR